MLGLGDVGCWAACQPQEVLGVTIRPTQACHTLLGVRLVWGRATMFEAMHLGPKQTTWVHPSW
jgi:hypothetical protein